MLRVMMKMCEYIVIYHLTCEYNTNICEYKYIIPIICEYIHLICEYIYLKCEYNTLYVNIYQTLYVNIYQYIPLAWFLARSHSHVSCMAVWGLLQCCDAK